MRIIALEGPSRVGKETQSKMLVETLQSRNFKAVRIDLPRYETPVGKLLYDMLHGDGPVDELTVHYLLEADRAGAQADLVRHQNDDTDFVVFDRYLMTGAIYGAVCRGYQLQACQNLQSFFMQPHLNIVIDLDPKEALRRVGFAKGDVYEQQLDLQQRLREAFYKVSITKNNAAIVDGAGSAMEVHSEVMRAVESAFPIVKRSLTAAGKKLAI